MRIVLLAVIWLVSLSPHPGLAAEGGGIYAFEFARLAVEPVGRSLGGAHLATVQGPSALAWNPAGLAGGEEGTCALVSHATWMAGTAWEWGGLGLRLPGRAGGLALSCAVLRSGSLPGYDAEGTATGDFHPLQILAAAGYARPLTGNLRAGVGLEAAIENDGESAGTRAWAACAGMQLDLGRLALGLAALHLAPRVTAGEEQYALPATLRAGLSLDVGAGLRLHAMLARVAEEDALAALAAEWQLIPALGLCGSAEYRRDAEGDPLLQPACGVVLGSGRTRFAYGYLPDQDLEASHQVSLSLPLSH